MRRPISFLLFCAFLSACVARQRVTVRSVAENLEATHRIDTLPAGSGSAIVLHEDGYLLTCRHVVIEPSGQRDILFINIAVDGGDPVAYPARIVAENKELDVAVIKVERRFETHAVLGRSKNVRVLDQVYNIGFPYSAGEVASIGWIKSTDGAPALYTFEQALLLDIPDGPGTSGSGIFLFSSGEVVGIMDQYRAFGFPSPGQVVIRVAVPIDPVRAWLDTTGVPYYRLP